MDLKDTKDLKEQNRPMFMLQMYWYLVGLLMGIAA